MLVYKYICISTIKFEFAIKLLANVNERIENDNDLTYLVKFHFFTVS